MRTDAPTHRTLKTNGVELKIVEQGSGPLIVMLHGFPETSYSWRHQVPALAAAGYRVVAPNQRCYPGSSRPDAIDQYTLLHLAGDVIGLIHALGEEKAIVVGHDWGAPVAWATALLRRDIVRGVVGLSVPPQSSLLPLRRFDSPPVQQYREKFGDEFYMVAFQERGPAEAILHRDIRASLLGMIVKANSVHRADSAIGEDNRPEDYDAATPSCLTEADLDAFAAEFTDCGFGTSIDWYRNMDRNWELLAPFDGAVITPPALYIRGEGDNMASSIPVPGSVAEQREVAPNAREIVTIPDCGHWIQQEQPAAVTAHILKFARELD